MDIAYFISDLLGQQGELSVPNLGYFVQMRMSAYYNEQEKRFYPPHYAVQFDPQVIDDDDTLAAHITARKKISLASSKYFIEKFVGNLRSQAQSEEVPFGGIGTFQSNGPQLVFKAGSKQDDPALFGLNPVALYGTVNVSTPPVQPAQPSQPAYTPQPQQTTAAYVPPPPSPAFTTTPAAVTERHVPQPPEPVYSTPPAYTPPPAPVEETQPYVQQRVEPTQYEYEDEKRGLGVWAIIGIIIIVLGAGTAALYYLKPQIFNGFLKEQNPYTSNQPTAPVKHTDSVQSSTAPDTATTVKSTLSVDTVATKANSTPEANTPPVENKPETAKPVAETPKPATTATKKTVETKPVDVPATTPSKPVEQPVTTAPASVPATTDGVAKGLWVIRAGTYQSKSGSDERLDQLKGKGFAQARLEKTNVKRGGNYKVILGVYKTKEEARSKADDLLATGKITKAEIGVEQVQ